MVKQWSTPVVWQGYCAAAKLKVTTNSLLVQWAASDWIYKLGGPL